MNQLTVSYGLISPDYCTSQDAHILPITKILYPNIPGKNYFLTSGRDGSIILHKNMQISNDVESRATTTSNGAIRMQVHSDWASDLIHVSMKNSDPISEDTFISVSHDFSIVLISVNIQLTTWDKKIIGDHDDYIKCIVPIPYETLHDNEINEQESGTDIGYDETNHETATGKLNHFLFATGGLDRKIKVWCLGNGPEKVATLMHTFDNAQSNDTGSIYSMSSVVPEYKFDDNQTTRPFDLVAGDCNGDLIFYSCRNRKEVVRIGNAHNANIKVVRTVNDSTRLISTSSDGVINVWDLNCKHDQTTGVLQEPKKIGSWSWDSSIWCVQGTSLDQLYFGDSQGNVMTANLSSYKDAKLTRIFKPNRHQHHEHEEHNISNHTNTKVKKYGGILDIALLPNEKLLFSFCTDSNLNELDLTNNHFSVNEGGFALTRSSLLTDRRHVITENTKGQMQRWDIVSCELLDTFGSSEGSFDDIVMKYTSKEILSHWCTVSVKVGMLFVKINPKFLKTEIYGSALKDYQVVNNIEVNSDERYNLGKIVINSLFNEFISYEVQKDKILRKKILSLKKKDLNSSLTLDTGCNTESKKNSKEKKRKSTFKLSSTLSIGNTNGSGTPPNSAPATPIMAEITMLEEQPLLQSPHDKTVDDSLELVQPLPTSKKPYFRTQSSGSLLSRKFKSFRSTSGRATTGLNTPEEPKSNFLDTAHVINDESTISQPINAPQQSKDATPESILWNHPFKLEQKLSAISSQDLPSNNVHNKLKSGENSRANSTLTLEGNEKKDPEFMPDLLEQIQESYKQQFMNTSSLKYLTKRLPATKIVKASSCPIIKIKSATLVLVHLWKEGSCGGRVLFSTLLPPSRVDYETVHSGKENSKLPDDEELELQALDDDKLGQYDLIDGEQGGRLNRRQIFEQLEENLPYWFAKALFRDIKTVEEQPKLNFLIMPWSPVGRSETNGSNENKKKNISASDTTESSANDSSDSSLEHSGEAISPSTQQQFHNMLKFGRPKTSEQELNPTDLPKISEANVKLVAPGMIRVKKIKLYVADRFESKTPEMKAKIEPSLWLDLICRGQVLDNDMTLNTVRTLYWKSQGDIILEYRRKVHNSPLIHEVSGNEGKCVN